MGQRPNLPDAARFAESATGGRVGLIAGVVVFQERLLSPFPVSSGAEERGMKFSRGIPRVALGDSLTRGYFL